MIMVLSAPTALRRSGRANRAMYMIFIRTLQAILDSVPSGGDPPLAVPPFGGEADDPPCGGVVLGRNSSMAVRGSFASSRNGVGAVPTLVGA